MHTPNLKENGLLQLVHLLSGRGEACLQDSSAKMGKHWQSFGQLISTEFWWKVLGPRALGLPKNRWSKHKGFGAGLTLGLQIQISQKTATCLSVPGCIFLWNRGGL